MIRFSLRRAKTPIAISIIAWAIFILFVVRLYQAVMPLWQLQLFQTGRLPGLFANGWLTQSGSLMLTGLIYAFLSLSGIIVLIGFLRVKRWSWVVLMVWTAVSLTTTLLDYLYQEPNYIVMASDTIIAFALNQADVLRIFGIRAEVLHDDLATTD